MSDFLKQIADFSPKRLLLLAAELEERVRALELELSEQKLRRDRDPIAIVGMGCRFPGGADSPQQFWELLTEGRDAITEVPDWRWSLEELYDPNPHAKGKVATRWGGFLDAPEMFDAAFFGIAPVEALSMDPQQRLLLEVTWEALEDAGIAPAKLNGSKTGVYVGLCNSDYGQIAMNDSPEGLDAYFATGASHSVAAGRISYFLGLRGPSMAIDTACSASLVSVHEACQGLRMGESDLAVAGGVNLVLIPEVTMALSRAQMMSPDGRCKAFSAAANGFVRSEGCGIVVLKRLVDAERDGDRVLAVVRGTAINQDGRSSGLTAPNGPSQVEVIRAALKDAGLSSEAVSYVEAHGTGTGLGDTIEMQAIGEALGNARGLRDEQTRLPVGSVKSNFGHTESAAGVAGLIKLVLALQHKTIPASLHCLEPNPAIDWATSQTRVPKTSEEWQLTDHQPLRVGALSSFGFSGTNAHVVVSEVPSTSPSNEEIFPVQPVLLSARSERALKAMTTRLRAHLAQNPGLRLTDIAYTLAAGRSVFGYRAALRADSTPHLIEELDGLSASTDDSAFLYAQSKPRVPRVAFLFAGQGGEHTGMGLFLLQHSPTFRSAVAEVDAALTGVIPHTIEAIFRNEQNQLSHSAFVQPALFAFQYGLARVWQSFGVEPSIVAGHSMGEIVAATIAGVFSLSDAAQLVAARGRLTGELADPGGMVAVAASLDQVQLVLVKYTHDVSIAAINGPTSLVISGRGESLESATQEFEAAGIRVKRLNITYGSHSPAMHRVLSPFYDEAAKLKYHAPVIPIVADLTGDKVQEDSIFDADYWTKHLGSSVQFAHSLETLRSDGATVCIEMGPRAVLTTFGRELNDQSITWIASATGREDDFSALQSAIAEAFVAGVTLDGKAIFNWTNAQVISLPTYPFERERFWPTERSSDPRQQRIPKGTPSIGVADNQTGIASDDSQLSANDGRQPGDTGEDWLYKQSWESRPLVPATVPLDRNWILLGDADGLAGLVKQSLITSGEQAEVALDVYRSEEAPSTLLSFEYVDLRCLESFDADKASFSAEVIGDKTVSLTARSYDLWQHAIETSSRLWLFTLGAQMARDHSAIQGAIEAPLWGLARCATMEQPQILRRITDLDPSLSLEERASIVTQELLSIDEEEQVAYDKQSRLAFRIRQESEQVGVSEKIPVLRKDGTYLVTGGLGGLGLTVATWLGQQGVGKIVLTTRSQSSIEAAKSHLDLLTSQGIDVEVVPADVTDRNSMAELFARFDPKSGWPTLRGVFHLAMGTPDMGSTLRAHSVEGIKPASLPAIFAAKVTGTCILRELTKNLELDFLLGFSSTAAITGASQLSHYAAANSFVDAIANVSDPGAPPFLSISWGQWETVRLASTQVKQIYSAGGLLPMNDALAMAWMGRLLDGSVRQPMVARIDWQVLAPVYEAKRRRSWLEYLRGIGVDRQSSAEQLQASSSVIDTIDVLEMAIRQEAARVLGLRHGGLPDSQTPLPDLGLDSLMAVTLRNRLQLLTGHSLPSTFAFEYPTTAQMASALDLLMWGSGDPGRTAEGSRLELRSDPLHPLLKDEERDEIRI